MKSKVDRVTLVGFAVLIGVFVIIFGIYGYTLYKDSLPPKLGPAQDIASVGELKIDSDLYSYYFFDMKAREEQQQNITDQKGKNSYWAGQQIDGKPAMEWLKDQTLESARQHVLLVDKAKKDGMELSKEEKKQNQEALDGQLKEAFGEESNIDTQIRKLYHISLDTFKEIMGEAALIQKYYQEGFKSATDKITDEDAEKYYKKNPTEFVDAQVRHILIKTTDDEGNELSKAKKKEAKQRAEDILAKVVSGEDMEQLAINFSEDPGVKDGPDGTEGNKGIYDVNASAGFVESFKKFALSKPVNSTGIVESEFGYHVMKVLKSKKKELKDIKEEIKGRLAQENFDDILMNYLEKESPKAVVDNENGILQIVSLSLQEA